MLRLCLHKKMHLDSRWLCGFLLAGAAPLMAQTDCKPVFDALDKVMSTPTHIYSSTKEGGKPKTTETIYSGDAIFTNETGKWARSEATVKQVTTQEAENRRKSVHACHFVKDEPVNGELAAVYSAQAATTGQKSDAKIWISKSNGLPLRNEVDLQLGGKSEKNHYSVRYDYKNVDPPKL